MFDVQAWLNTGAQLMIAGGVGFGIYQRVMETRQAAQRAVEALAATGRAEEAARLAAAHAADAAAGVALFAVNVEKIELATNSMKDPLVASTAKASHLEGREEQRSEMAAKTAAAAKP
jgi:hypothetical protein